MSLKTYTISTDITLGAVSIKKLHAEIEATAHVTGFSGLIQEGDSLVVEGTTLANEAALDALILAHDTYDLDVAKAAKNLAIDIRTQELIGAGFTFDSTQFSLSANAQTNWLGIKTLSALLSWPVEVSTLADAAYDLAEVDLDNFIGTGMATLQAHLDSGRALKVSVNAAADQVALDAIVDNR